MQRRHYEECIPAGAILEFAYSWEWHDYNLHVLKNEIRVLQQSFPCYPRSYINGTRGVFRILNWRLLQQSVVADLYIRMREREPVYPTPPRRMRASSASQPRANSAPAPSVNADSAPDFQPCASSAPAQLATAPASPRATIQIRTRLTYLVCPAYLCVVQNGQLIGVPVLVCYPYWYCY